MVLQASAFWSPGISMRNVLMCSGCTAMSPALLSHPSRSSIKVYSKLPIDTIFQITFRPKTWENYVFKWLSQPPDLASSPFFSLRLSCFQGFIWVLNIVNEVLEIQWHHGTADQQVLLFLAYILPIHCLSTGNCKDIPRPWSSCL